MRFLNAIVAVCLLLSAACGSTGSHDTAGRSPHNDPRSGWISLRVVDDTTGQPIANTRCRMLSTSGVSLQQGGAALHDELFSWEGMPSTHAETGRPEPARWLTSDESGELVVALHFVDDEWNSTSAEDAALIVGDSLYPLPDHFAPVTTVAQLALEISRAWTEPGSSPIEVRVRRFGSIVGRVLDSEGRPVAGARILGNVTSPWNWARYVYPGHAFNPYHPIWSWIVTSNERADAIRSHVHEPAALTSVDRTATHHDVSAEWNMWLAAAVVTDEDGTFSFAALPGEWILTAAGGGYDVSTLHLNHGHETSRVTIRSGPRLSSLRLSIDVPHHLPEDWREDSEHSPHPGQLRVVLGAAPPTLTSGKPGADEFVFTWRGRIEPQVGSSVLIDFTGLPPVWMEVHVGLASVWSARHFLLAPGETGELVLALGEGEIQLELDPPGIRPEAIEIEIETPPTLARSTRSFERDSEYKLSQRAGSYIAHLPDGSRVPVEVRHGEVTTLRVESPLKRLEFRLDAELAELLGEPVELSLSQTRGHSGRWTFEEDITVTLVPAGVYGWTLQGSKASVGAEINLRAPADVIELTRDSLPGLERLDVEIVGPPEIELQPQRRNPHWHSGSRESKFLPAGSAAKAEAGRWVVWGPAGGFELLLREADGTVYRLEAMAPGAMRIDWSTPRAAFTVAGEAPDGYQPLSARLTIDGNTFIVESDRSAATRLLTLEMRVPAGTYEATVWAQGRLGHREFRWRGELPQDGMTFVISELQPSAASREVEYKLTVTGPESTFRGEIDAAMREAMQRFAQAGPVLYRRHGDGWRLMQRLPAHAAWGERELARRFTTTLPPGRYRLDAWPGAPEKYRKEFTVADKDITIELSLD